MMQEGELVMDQPEGDTDGLYHEEQPIYPSSYNIANPPIPVQNNSLAYLYGTDHLNQVPYQQYVTNQNIIHTSNDTTHLLAKRKYLNDQHVIARHSYLASPGRTMSSCNKPNITLKSFIITTYSFIIIVIDYLILPISVLLLLTTMVFMIMEQCSNKIINEYTHTTNDNQITSNCQCAVNQEITRFDHCICHGIDDNAFDVTHNGLIRIFCVTLLVFLTEYLSFMFFIFYAFCKCLCCCGRPCCCLCWEKLKFSPTGYYLSVLTRIIQCVACWYYMHVNSQNVHCQCPYNNDVVIINPDYCGPWHMDKYMKVLWQFCRIYFICCLIFLTGRLVLRWFINKKKYQYLKLLRMVFYQK